MVLTQSDSAGHGDSPDSYRGPRVSVIVPVYNVAAYVEACLESIREQIFDAPFEVIVIDDCSTDDSHAVCERFVARYPERFALLRNSENQGVSVTRNRGLDEARGEYFMFVDPDDLLPREALARLFSAAEESRCSIVKGNNTIFDDRSERDANYNVRRRQQLQADAVLTTLFRHESVRGHPWGRLFRSDRLGHLRFPTGVRMAQDLFYNCSVFAESDSLLLLDQTVYRYRHRETGSTGRKYISGAYLEWLDSVERAGQFASTRRQKRAHKNLLVRTLAQLARECRRLPVETARPVYATLQERCRRWQVNLPQLIFGDRQGLRSISRYFRMRQAAREISRKIRAGRE